MVLGAVTLSKSITSLLAERCTCLKGTIVPVYKLMVVLFDSEIRSIFSNVANVSAIATEKQDTPATKAKEIAVVLTQFFCKLF